MLHEKIKIYNVGRLALLSWWKQACVPRHSLAVHSEVQIAAGCWLLSSTVCSSKASAGAGAGAGASAAHCMADCMDTTHLSAGHSTLMMWMAIRPWNGLCYWLTVKELICCFLGTGFLTYDTSSTSSPSSLACFLEIKLLMLLVVVPCSCDSALSWGSLGRAKVGLAPFGLCNTQPPAL